MMRAMGLVLLLGCSGTAGFWAARRIRQQWETIRRLLSLLDSFAARIRYQSLPLEELIAQTVQCPEFAGLGFLHRLSFSPDTPFAVQWQRVLEEERDVPRRAVQVLLSLGSTLGTTDGEGQLSALALYRQEMERAEQEWREKYRTQGALYPKLGLLGGAVLVLLFL